MANQTIADVLGDINWVDVPTGQVKFERTVRTGQHTTKTVKDKANVDGFTVMQVAITNKQFQTFMTAYDGYKNLDWWGFSKAALDSREADLKPSTNPKPSAIRNSLNWFTVIAFSQWLSNVTGELYRMPTEYEWHLMAQQADDLGIVVEKREWAVADQIRGYTAPPYGTCTSVARGKARDTEDILSYRAERNPRYIEDDVGFRLVKTGKPFSFSKKKSNIKLAVEKAKSKKWKERSDGFNQLTVASNQESMKALLQLLKNPDVGIKLMAVSSLKVLSDRLPIPAKPLIDQLSVDHNNLRRAIQDLLRMMGAKAKADMIETVSTHKDEVVRAKVLKPLFGLMNGNPTLLLNIVSGDNSNIEKEEALIIISHSIREPVIKDQRFIQALLDITQDEDAPGELRVIAIRVAGLQELKQLRAIIENMTDHPDESIAKQVKWALNFKV